MPVTSNATTARGFTRYRRCANCGEKATTVEVPQPMAKAATAVNVFEPLTGMAKRADRAVMLKSLFEETTDFLNYAPDDVKEHIERIYTWLSEQVPERT